MAGKSKTKEQLITEIAGMRERVAKLEKSESELKGIIGELKKPEQQYQTILDSMGDAISIIDKELRIVFVNRAFTEWIKAMPLKADIVGLTVFEA
ncbi:MAG TPA: PAS domain-containing protein, partial [Syntrophales bacterium]|nr:PAS domain-containing protein [Syntrophales bacterium]